MKLTFLKWLVLFQIGLALFECYRSSNGQGAPESGPDELAALLALFFFAREAVNDERIDALKLKAVRAGFLGGLCVLLLWNGLLAREFVLPRISAFTSVSIIMLSAISIFYYWRWQDGQASKGDCNR